MKNLFRDFLKAHSVSRPVARRRRSPRWSRPVEALEDRTLLAGNVLATLSNGTLTLTGDAAANQVELKVASGNVVVEGTLGTTINGGTAVFTVVTGGTRISGDVIATLGAGADSLLVNGILIGAGVSIDAGDGDDSVQLRGTAASAGALSSLRVTDDLTVRGGLGNDTISFDTGVVFDNVELAGDDGNDTLALFGISSGDSIELEGGAGNDTISIRTSSADDDLRIDGGEGADQVRIEGGFVKDFLAIDTGAGTDNVILRTTGARRDASIQTGDGDDTLNLISSVFGDGFRADTGAGNDMVVTDRMFVDRDARIETGDGADRIVVQASGLSSSLFLQTGSGNDIIHLSASTVRFTTLAAAGEGDDIVNTVNGVYRGLFLADAGTGTDAVEIAASTQLRGGRVTPGVESTDADDTVVNALLNDATNGALTRVAAIESVLRALFAPVAVNDTVTAPNGTVTTTAANGVLVNDTSTTGGTLVVARETQPANGTVTVNSNGTFTYTAGTGFTGTDSFTYRITEPFTQATATATVTVLVQRVPLTLDAPPAGVIQSNGTLVTQTALYNVAGTTTPGATVAVARDGDNQFDDGTATAGTDGRFTIPVTLLHNDTNDGANTLRIRATFSDLNSTQDVSVHLAEGTVVRYASSLGNYDIELFDDDAPQTVAAFLADLDRYNNSIVHRNDEDFVIQGGGTTVSSTGVIGSAPDITPSPPNEFALASNSNVRGTLSTAQVGGNINSFSGEWFVNVNDDNDFLDDVPHTVFGRVIGTGMAVVDQINQLPVFDLRAKLGQSVFGELPLRNYTAFGQALTGTVSVTAGTRDVTGTGTSFTTALVVGEAIRIGTQQFTVSAITDDTHLTLSTSHTAGATGATANIHPVPTQANYVLSPISQLLPST